MRDNVDVLVIAGMIDRKFLSKVLPLMGLHKIRRIYVVRRNVIAGDKIKCFAPTGIMARYTVLAELHRLLSIIYVLLKFRPSVVIGIGLILHGIYANVLGCLFGRKKILLLMGKNDLGLTFPNRKRLQSVLLRAAFLADFIGTRGSRSRSWLIEKGFDANKVFIVHNVFDFVDFRPLPDVRKRYDLIYVGLLKYYKRVDLLIDVVHRLVKEDGSQDLRLAIVGGGPLKSGLQKKSATLGVDSNVAFLPPGNADYVCELLNRSKVFVMTSQGEGLPMAVIEALSCGLPVVIFDDADIGDVVHHGKNGLLVELGDLDSFVEAVRGLLDDKQRYDRLSRSALAIRTEYKHLYSSEAIENLWGGVLTECAPSL